MSKSRMKNGSLLSFLVVYFEVFIKEMLILRVILMFITSIIFKLKLFIRNLQNLGLKSNKTTQANYNCDCLLYKYIIMWHIHNGNASWKMKSYLICWNNTYLVGITSGHFSPLNCVLISSQFFRGKRCVVRQDAFGHEDPIYNRNATR